MYLSTSVYLRPGPDEGTVESIHQHGIVTILDPPVTVTTPDAARALVASRFAATDEERADVRDRPAAPVPAPVGGWRLGPALW